MISVVMAVQIGAAFVIWADKGTPVIRHFRSMRNSILHFDLFVR